MKKTDNVETKLNEHKGEPRKKASLSILGRKLFEKMISAVLPCKHERKIWRPERLAEQKDKKFWLLHSLNTHLFSSYSALGMIQSIGDASGEKNVIKISCSHGIYLTVI